MTSIDADVDPARVSEKLSEYQKECLLLDVREEDEYALGHIPGAVNVPLSDLHNRIKELKKDKSIVAICLSGGRAKVAAKLLGEKGFNVKIMAGGMRSWKGAVVK
ncbi:MAG: rhodanese-like domain-containing protein [Candidatus Altiarchaeia archaeon]